MNPEIKRLLKLSSIPGFKLTQKELDTLEAWKAKQKPVKVVKKMRSKASKTRSKTSLDVETVVDTSEPEIACIPTVRIQNVIKSEDLTLNQES